MLNPCTVYAIFHIIHGSTFFSSITRQCIPMILESCSSDFKISKSYIEKNQLCNKFLEYNIKIIQRLTSCVINIFLWPPLTYLSIFVFKMISPWFDIAVEMYIAYMTLF